MQLNIGEKVKNLRKQKKLSILQLSQLSEVSTGLISQIERDMVVPSVVSIYKIAQALETNIGYFFDDEKASDQVIVRSDDRKTIIMNKGKGIYEMLSPATGEHLIDFVMITLKSGHVQDRGNVTHDGEECGFVLKGTLTVSLNGEDHVLHEGDSIYFSSKLPHKYQNFGDEDCVSLWAMTPPFF